MSKNLSAHRHFYSTRRAVIVAACLIAFVSVIFALAIRHSQAALLSPQGKSPINSLWQDVAESSIPGGERQIIPNAYRTVRLDLATLKKLLESAPMEFTRAAKDAPIEISMPMPDGKFSRFKIAESPMMEQELAEKFPEIKNYSGHGIDDPTASMRCALTPDGFHAFILSPEGTVLVDPYARNNTLNYISYYLRNDPREKTFNCFVQETDAKLRRPAGVAPQAMIYAGTLHTYRLAVAATGEYTAQNGGTVASALAAINTRVMGVNAIFGVEVSVRLSLIGNENEIIYTDLDAEVGSPTRPYTTQNLSSLISENQSNLDNVIGNGSYDIGQVFDASGTGGLARLNSVCDSNNKGRGTSGGNSVTLAAHEIAHQFGATHTFNDSMNSSCGSFNGSNQRDAESAYEPGSGSTLMSYCGTCGPANLQQIPDSYFHIRSIEQIIVYINNGGSGCDTEIETGNRVTAIFSILSYNIPSRTPFRLDAGVIEDPDGDVVSYTWEEYDLGEPSPPEGDDGGRPIFRSVLPVPGATGRNFPRLTYILNNANNPPATYNCAPVGSPPVNCLTGESLPTTTRTMIFQETIRDNHNNGPGLVNGGISSFSVPVHVDGNSGPFVVTQPNTNVAWGQATRKAVIWNVANTTAAPVNCADVRITLSTDGGITFDIELAESTPNDGMEAVTLPNLTASGCRIKIEAVGNIFFDISDVDFSIVPLAVTNTNLVGAGSLRQAIDDANSDPSLSIITFDFQFGGVHTINVGLNLPMITTPVVIDGWSQGGEGYSGPPLIELNGAGANPGADGLVLAGGNSTVNGLAINRFPRHGILMQSVGGNLIEGCYLGTDPSGTTVRGNGGSGVFILGIPNNQLGSPTTLGQAQRNIFAGNNVGVTIDSISAVGNSLYHNLIGTNADGTRLANTSDGIRINDAPNNVIGGTRTLPSGISIGTGNVISGNNSDGIQITGSLATGNSMQANLIGLTLDGTTALGNAVSGINITGAPGNIIGGTDNAAAGNIISGNSNFGGIALLGSGSSGTIIHGNYLGTTADGSAAIGNNVSDIYIESANNLIGGTTPRSRNVISARSSGIALLFGGATGNMIQGNYIGTDATGTVALGMTGTGIVVRGANNNLIGGTTPAARNIISGNGTGIYAIGGTTNLLIRGNYIGTNPDGTAVVGNRFPGVIIEGSSNNTIGGTSAGAGNVISGNGTGGGYNTITLSAASGNTVQGNFIGTNAAGTAALGNGGSGIVLAGPEPSNNNLIGGTSAAARNLISANAGDGILITAYGNGNNVQGNFIGTDVAGAIDLGNGYSGVEIASGDNNVIGGTGAGSGNLIAFNGIVNPLFGDGVRVSGGFTDGVLHGIGNRIRGNAIFSNVRLGIDLLGGIENSGVTANDSCGADTGANKLQNFPVLTSAITSGLSVTVDGTLNTTASTTLSLDFYANAACDASGNGEGQTYLGSTTVATDGSCNVTFNITFAAAVPVGHSITATATDSANNTSEFSACLTVGCGYALSPTGQFFPMNGGAGSLDLLAGGNGCSWLATVSDDWVTLTSSESGSGNDTITFEVRENFTGSARQATIAVAGQLFTVVQDGGLGEDCQYGIAPAFNSFSAGGGAGTVSVFAAERCAWEAVSSVSWVTITSVSAGIADGQVNYSVAANPGASGRKGTIAIAGQVFAVKQKGN